MLISDFFGQASNGSLPLPTTLASQKVSGASSMSLVAATGWSTATVIFGLLYQVNAAGVLVPGSVLSWKGILSGTTVGSLTIRGGTDATYPAGSIVQVQGTDAWADDLMTGLAVEHNANGTHGAITSTGATLTTPTIISPAKQGIDTGFVGVTDSWAYASANTIIIPSNSMPYDIGDILTFVQSTTTKYFVITVVTSTLLTVVGLGGAVVANTGISAIGYSKGRNPHGAVAGAPVFNPYKFSVYCSTSPALSAGVPLRMPLDTKNFDSNGNFDIVTNHRYVVPVAGTYWINGQVSIGVSGIAAGAYGLPYIFKNGAEAKRGLQLTGSGTGSSILNLQVADLFQLAAGDDIELWADTSDTGRNVTGGSNFTYMSGFLVSLA